MRLKRLERFNEKSGGRFLNDYQKAIREIFYLQSMKKHTKINVARSVRRVTLRPPKGINTDINKGVLLSMNLEAEIYYELQEQIKKVTGTYMAMDEFLHYIIVHFIYQYKFSKKYIPPYVVKKKMYKLKRKPDDINKKCKIKLFYKRFKQFMD